MAAQSVASRTDRHHNVDPDDVVLKRAMEMSDWARRNRRLIMALAAAALVAVAGLLYWRYYQAAREASAGAAFFELQQGAEANPAATRTRLASFIAEYSGTHEADEARLLLATLHLNENQARQAVPVLQPLAGDGGSPMAPQAGILLGDAQAQAGDRNAAIAAYLAAAGEAELDYQKAEALERAAMLREQGNDFKGAIELHRQVVEIYEKGSPERLQAEMRLAEAEGRARGR